MKKYIRVIDGEEISVDSAQDFVDNSGVHHPRNILWHWSDKELWKVLQIKAVISEDNPDPVLDAVQIPLPVEPPAPVPDSGSLPPPPEAPLAPPAPPPGPVHIAKADVIIAVLESSPGKPPTQEEIALIHEKVDDLIHSDATISEMVAYGNIAIRTLRLSKRGDFHQGHRHNYDHITNVVKGSVLCEVEGAAPRKFIMPAQITVAADKWHKFTALEDDTVYQCVYAQPNRIDLYDAKNSPYGHSPFTADEIRTKLADMDHPCAHCDCDKTDE